MRREYIIWMPIERIVGLFNLHLVPGGTSIHVPRLDGAGDMKGNRVEIPTDAKVRHAGYDLSRNAIGFIIQHDSFPEVDDGAQAQSLSYPTVTVTLRDVDVDSPITIGG